MEGGGVKDDGMIAWEAGCWSLRSFLKDRSAPVPIATGDAGASVEGSEEKLCCKASKGVVGASSSTVTAGLATAASVVGMLDNLGAMSALSPMAGHRRILFVWCFRDGVVCHDHTL